MAVRNRYNDPALGAAFENIASLFAPVSSQELAGYATADLTRQKAAAEAQRMGLVDMFTQGGDDRIGVAAGLYAPNQSYYAVDQGNATARHGQGLDYRASRENNTADNARFMELGRIGDATDRRGQDLDFRALTENNVRDNQRQVQMTAIDSLLNPLSPGEQTREIGDDVWAAMGLPTMPSTPEYVNSTPSGSAKLTNVVRPDGSQGYALETHQGLVDPDTQTRLPGNTTMFSTAAQGSADDVGLGKTPVGKWQQELVDIETTAQIGNRLVELVQANPASQGSVGWIRGTAQNMIQSGNEIGAYFGGTIQSVANDVSAGVADASLLAPGGAFDPTLPAIDMLMNTYIYNVAKATTGERLTNEAIRQWRQSMGDGGVFSNQADTLARIAETQKTLQGRGDTIRGVLSTGQMPAGSGTAALPAAPPPSTPAVPAVGTVEDGYRFLGGNPSDPASWEPVQ